MSGLKHNDAGKLDVLSLPLAALVETAAVATMGAAKYERHNYLLPGEDSRYLNSALRHILQFCLGEDYDPDSGRHHLAHAAMDCLIAGERSMRSLGTDDRSELDEDLRVDLLSCFREKA